MLFIVHMNHIRASFGNAGVCLIARNSHFFSQYNLFIVSVIAYSLLMLPLQLSFFFSIWITGHQTII